MTAKPIHLLCCLLLAFQAGAASAKSPRAARKPARSPKVEAKNPEVSERSPLLPVVGLSAAIKKNLTGLEAEDWERGRRGSDLRQQAQAFVQFRRSRMTPKRKLVWIADCFSRVGRDNIYCDYVVERHGRRETFRDDSEPEPVKNPADIFKLSEQLSQTDLPALASVPEAQFQRALKLYPNWDPLQDLAEAALASRACPSTALLTALGQKAEEFFPEPRFRKLAVALYERSADCGADESATKARYRASLLEIWDGRCKKAEPGLVALSEQKNGDFVARSLYWRVHCARQEGNKLLASVMRMRLLKEYPLSYHGVILSRDRRAEVAKILDQADSRVRFRSEVKAELNRLVRGAEMLQRLHANDLALELLDALAEKLEGSETAFRLYVALLLDRSGDGIGKFKVLAGVFRDQPAAISRGTLELFYPLRQLDMLRRYGAKVDPYLVAALIRQESGFNARARSPAGALGLMQLMPETARRMERVSRRELFDAKTNVRLGVKYFHGLLGRYRADAELALAAYNAGPERVDEWVSRYPTSNRMLFFDLIPFKETRDYVALISRNYFWYLNLYTDSAEPGALRAGRRPASSKMPLVFTMFSSI